jgi:hypothetical protein
MLNKIFDRDPVIYVGAIQALLVMLLSFGALDWIGLSSQDQLMIVVALLTAAGAVATAFKTHRTLLAPIVELFKAGVAVAAIYGLNITTEQTGTVIAFIMMVAAFFHQSQVHPLTQGTFQLLPPTSSPPA